MKTAFVRDCLLWAARKLHRRAAGQRAKCLIVTIADQRGETVLKFTNRSAEAVMRPPWQSISTRLSGGDQVLAFSQDEETILAAIKAAGVISLKSLIVRTRIKRSRCALLASNLKERGAIDSGPEGYSLKQFQNEQPPCIEEKSAQPGGHIVAAFSEEDELILEAIREAGVLPLKQLILAVRSNMGATLCKFHVKNLRKRNAVQLTPDGYSLSHFKPERTNEHE